MLLHYLVKVTHQKSNIIAGDYQRKSHQMYHSFIKVDKGALSLLIWGVTQQCMYETIQDVDDLRKLLIIIIIMHSYRHKVVTSEAVSLTRTLLMLRLTSGMTI